MRRRNLMSYMRVSFSKPESLGIDHTLYAVPEGKGWSVTRAFSVSRHRLRFNYCLQSTASLDLLPCQFFLTSVDNRKLTMEILELICSKRKTWKLVHGSSCITKGSNLLMPRSGRDAYLLARKADSANKIRIPVFISQCKKKGMNPVLPMFFLIASQMNTVLST